MTHGMNRKKIRFMTHGLYSLFCWILIFLPLGCGLSDHGGEDAVIVIGSERLSEKRDGIHWWRYACSG